MVTKAVMFISDSRRPLSPTLCAAISAGCIFLLFFDLVRMIEIEKRDDEMHEYKRLPLIFRFFLPLVSNVGFVANLPLFDVSRRSTEEMIQMASLDHAVSGRRFFALKIFMAFFGFLLFIVFALMDNALSGLLLGVAFAVYPSVWLKQIVARRHLSILKALPNVLDLLTLSVEAGKDFLTALRDIMARRKEDPLGEELNRVLHEIQLGKGRQAALKEMSERVRQPELSSVVNAEKLANEAPVKILFPVVVFIFPSVFIILIGPIVYQALRTLAR